MNEDVRRYPLQWPVGWKRTEGRFRQRASFSKGVRAQSGHTVQTQLTVFDATQRLQLELGRLNGVHEVLSTNVQSKLDGLPRSGTSEPSDTGAAVYFAFKGRATVLACDRYDRVADNIAAIAAHIEALRRIDRYGVGTMEQALAGYRSLPPDASHDWHLILGVSPFATPEEIDAAFRAKARTAHPDTGGSHDEMARLSAARMAGKAAR